MRQVPSENKKIKGRGAIARHGVSSRAKRRRRKIILFYFLTFVFVISIAVVLSLTVLFRINTIQIDNTSNYSTEEILEVCGIEKGENLFLADVDRAQADIDRCLPYSSNVQVKRKLPDILQITIAEPEIAQVFEQDGQYLLVNEENKIVAIQKSDPGKYLLVSGVKMKNPKAGLTFSAEEKKVGEIFAEVKQMLNTVGLEDITRIDLSDPYQIMAEYDGRIRIQIGNSNDLQMKLASAKKIIDTELSPDEKGELDVSFTRDLKKAYYNADSPASSKDETEQQLEESSISESSDISQSE